MLWLDESTIMKSGEEVMREAGTDGGAQRLEADRDPANAIRVASSK